MMVMLSRRQFVAWASATVPLALVTSRADALASKWIAAEDATLRALAEVVLPSELHTADVARIAAGFQRWIDAYREHVELTHGYGTSALRFTRPSPKAAWAAQLANLRPLATMPVDKRRDTVKNVLKDLRVDRMPDVASAPHVVVALMSYYFTSSEALDLAHQAQIGREECRPLSASSRKPLPLAPRGNRA